MINNRYDFVMLFDVENGNPNGDPDAGNTPRIDAESGYGYITDVCLKRKIRNYVELVKGDTDNYRILIKADRSLNAKIKEAYEISNSTKIDENDDALKLTCNYMCEKYFDVRTFGAVMSTSEEKNKKFCYNVRGPVQINFAKSQSPINIQDVTITRQARTTKDRMETGSTEMGKKSIVHYALYRAEGYVSAALANKTTKLSEEDLELLWNAIINMFEEDHSAARGKMCMRKLIIFKHDNELGNCPSHILFDKINVEEVTAPPRKFSDYSITIDKDMPNGVELIEKL